MTFNPLRRQWVGVAILACLPGLVASPAVAANNDKYPSRPIRLIVPFTPGGGTDTLARSLAERLGAELGGTVVVENKPGAGSVIGTDAVARSEPDGYTLLIASSAHAINASFMPKLPYDTEKAFAAVALVGKAPNVIVVRPDSPIKTVTDIVRTAKAQPGKLTFGSSGNGTAVHLAGELFKIETGTQLTHVPYRGAGPALNDLYGGQIDMFFGTASAVAPAVQRGQLRAIATTLAERSPAWPKTPTVAEAGFPDYAADVWYAVFAAAGTPSALVERLNQAIAASVSSPEFRKRTESEGLSSPKMSPSEVDRYVRAEIMRWAKVVKEAGVSGG